LALQLVLRVADGHAVTIVGFDNDNFTWTLLNSWGSGNDADNLRVKGGITADGVVRVCSKHTQAINLIVPGQLVLTRRPCMVFCMNFAHQRSLKFIAPFLKSRTAAPAMNTYYVCTYLVTQ
jgi:hypothetical protein